MTPTMRLFLLAAPLCASAIQPALAQDAPPADDTGQDSVLVDADQGSNNSGRVAVNIASGSQNQQAGAAVIAIGDIAAPQLSVGQHIATPDLTDRATIIMVGPNSFSNNSGMVSVNLTAGSQNQSASLASLAIGNTGVVSDQMLAQTSAPTGPSGASAHGLEPANDSIVIDDSAFSSNSGLVQMNLVGGERNSSANTFALNISAGGEP